MYVYVASSWRNTFQPAVVAALRADGFEVYDFKDEDGFSWRSVDPEWQQWPADVKKYLVGMQHPFAERGFKRDMDALQRADLCVMVMPCGMSASLETGYARGAGKPTAVYIPGMREPDLMVKMADLVTDSLTHVRAWAVCQRATRPEAQDGIYPRATIDGLRAFEKAGGRVSGHFNGADCASVPVQLYQQLFTSSQQGGPMRTRQEEETKTEPAQEAAPQTEQSEQSATAQGDGDSGCGEEKKDDE